MEDYNKQEVILPVDLVHNLHRHKIQRGKSQSLEDLTERQQQQQTQESEKQLTNHLSQYFLTAKKQQGLTTNWSDALLVQVPATLLGSMVLSGATGGSMTRAQSMKTFGFSADGSYLGWQGIYDVYDEAQPSDEESWRQNIPRDWYLPLCNVSNGVVSAGNISL